MPRIEASGTPRPRDPVRVAVLADDVTGAGDTAVQFAEAGWPAFLQRTPRPPDLPEVAAVARALHTRALADELAAQRTGDAVLVQLGAGVTRLYLKIDSTMRGSVAAQLRGALAAWRTRHPNAFVVLCPAYPAMGRTISAGRLWVNGESLERSPAGADPVTPVKTSVLSELVPGSVVVPALPAAPLRAAIEAAAARAAVITCEVETPEHLRTLAEVVAGFGPAALPAGSAGLALPLASAWHPRPGDLRPAPLPTVQGRVVVALSSANEVSRRQVRACQEALGTRMQTATLALDDAADESRAARWASRLDLDPRAVVVALCAPAERLTGMDKLEAGARVARGLAAALHALLERERAGALVLLGGDGAEAILDRIGVDALRVRRRVVEGVPLSEAMGGTAAGLAVVTKAGGFGDERTLRSVIEKLQGEKE
jgi:uncharacterized protein YgbK (DUF1537 family)